MPFYHTKHHFFRNKSEPNNWGGGLNMASFNFFIIHKLKNEIREILERKKMYS